MAETTATEYKLVVQEHHLMIESLVESKASKFWGIFPIKDIIQNEKFSLSFKITNKGNNYFPGGICSTSILVEKHKTITTYDDMTVPGIAPNDNVIIKLEDSVPKSEGLGAIHVKISSNDLMKIRYYQNDEATNKAVSLPIDEWNDFIPIITKLEINQRYTNYLLITISILVFVTTILPFIVKS